MAIIRIGIVVNVDDTIIGPGQSIPGYRHLIGKFAEIPGVRYVKIFEGDSRIKYKKELRFDCALLSGIPGVCHPRKVADEVVGQTDEDGENDPINQLELEKTNELIKQAREAGKHDPSHPIHLLESLMEEGNH